jgi:hypothetical protein
VPRSIPETIPESDAPNNKGGDHAAGHHQRDLPRIPEEHLPRSGNPGVAPMIFFTAAFLLFSIAVFAAHAVDAYREFNS